MMPPLLIRNTTSASALLREFSDRVITGLVNEPISLIVHGNGKSAQALTARTPRLCSVVLNLRYDDTVSLTRRTWEALIIDR